MEPNPSLKRRDSERISVTDVQVEIARIDDFGDIHLEEGRSLCVDLSEGGMQIVSERMLAPGRRYGFRVVSSLIDKPNWFIGKVRWGCEIEDGKIRAGIAFDCLDESDRAVLTTLLHQHSRAVVM